MKRITVEAVRAAYGRLGYEPCRGEWRREAQSSKRCAVPVRLACPQTALLELEGLISHDEEGVNIETAADDHWGTAYANGCRDGWDDLESGASLSRAMHHCHNIASYDVGFADGHAAAAELVPGNTV